jgi:anthranilate synthase component 2
MQVVIIDNYDSFVYNIVRYINDTTESKAIVFRNDAIDFEVLKNADAIVLSPGPGIPSEAGKMMELIEEFHLTKPILGICLGHQALGEFFGSNLIQNKSPMHGVGTVIEHQSNSDFFKGIPVEFEVGRYHSWSIDDASNELEVTAKTVEGEVMAIQHQTLPIQGVQFHPESILTPHGRKMINNWIASITTKTAES